MITKVVFTDNSCTNLYQEPFALSVSPGSYSSDPWVAVIQRFLPLFKRFDAAICSDQIVVSGVEIRRWYADGEDRPLPSFEGIIRVHMDTCGADEEEDFFEEAGQADLPAPFSPGFVGLNLFVPLRSGSDWRFFEGLIWAAGAWELEGGCGPKTSNPLADLLCGGRLLESKGVEWEFCLDRSGASVSSPSLAAFADFAASVYPRLPSPSSR